MVFLPSFKPSVSMPQLAQGISIFYDGEKGRGLRADVDFPAGAVICVEKGITINLSKNRCYGCLALKKKNDLYCANCDPFDEPIELANGTFDDLGLFKLAFHAILTYSYNDVMLLLDQKVDWLEMKLETNSIRALYELQELGALQEELRKDESIQAAAVKVAELLECRKDWSRLNISERKKKLIKVFEIVSKKCARNAHAIHPIYSINPEYDKVAPIGTGLFPIASIFNHSCDPNVFSFFVENHVVYVSRGVRAGDELTDSYGVKYLHHTYDYRVNFLHELSGFTCLCEKCKNKESLDHLLEQQYGLNTVKKMCTSVKEFLKNLEMMPVGHQDVESSIMVFVHKRKYENDLLLKLWKRFLKNARARGFVFHEYLVRPCLEQLIGFYKKTGEREKYKEEIENLLMTSYLLLHTLYVDLHPASKPINNLIKGKQSCEKELIEMVEKLWA